MPRAAFAKEQIFRVGVQIIEGAAKAEEAGPAFANIAESIIAGLAARGRSRTCRVLRGTCRAARSA